MGMHFFSSAYSTGSDVGTVVRWLLLALILGRLIIALRSGDGGDKLRNYRIGIGVVVALMVASAYYDFGRSDDSPAFSAVQRNFMAGCTDRGAPASYCGCLLTELRNAGYDTEQEFAALDRTATTQAPGPLLTMAQTCFNRQ